MTAVIDDKGRVFGKVNIIDLLAVLVVIAVALGGVALISNTGAGTASTHEATFEATVHPSVAEALADRDPTGDVQSINDVTVVDSGAVFKIDEPNKQYAVVQFDTVLSTTDRDGLTYFDGQRLLIGQTYTLDVGFAKIDATLIEYSEISEVGINV